MVKDAESKNKNILEFSWRKLVPKEGVESTLAVR